MIFLALETEDGAYRENFILLPDIWYQSVSLL